MWWHAGQINIDPGLVAADRRAPLALPTAGWGQSRSPRTHCRRGILVQIAERWHLLHRVRVGAIVELGRWRLVQANAVQWWLVVTEIAQNTVLVYFLVYFEFDLWMGTRMELVWNQSSMNLSIFAPLSSSGRGRL